MNNQMLEKANQLSSSIKRRNTLLNILNASKENGKIVIGTRQDDFECSFSNSTETHFFDACLRIGSNSNFFDEPAIKELYFYFINRLIHIVENDLERLEKEFSEL